MSDLSIDKPKTSAKWEDYIKLSHDFDPATRLALKKTLLDIWLCADREGIDLIRRAAKRNGGKIRFVPGGRNIFDDTKPDIEISLEAAGKTVYLENGIARHASLNGILVHELYHATDPNPLPNVIEHYVQNEFHDLLLKHDVSSKVFEQVVVEINKLLKQKTGRYFVHGLMTSQLERVLHTVSLDASGFHTLAALTSDIPPEEFTKSLIAAGIVGPDGVKPWEERAVHFTDAFMLKNYGSEEPQRSTYTNGKLVEPGSPILILHHSSSPFGSPGFSVANTKVLAQCSYDEKSNCIAEEAIVTPRIKAAIAPNIER